MTGRNFTTVSIEIAESERDLRGLVSDFLFTFAEWFNYLMVDSHAAMLTSAETVGEKGEAGDKPSKHLGMWTVNPND